MTQFQTKPSLQMGWAHHVTLGLQSQKNLESIWLGGLLCPAQDPRASRMSWRPPFNRPRQPSANRSTCYLDWFLERHLQMGHLFSLNPIKCFWVYSAGYSHHFLNNYTQWFPYLALKGKTYTPAANSLNVCSPIMLIFRTIYSFSCLKYGQVKAYIVLAIEDTNKWEKKNFDWFHPIILLREKFSSY